MAKILAIEDESVVREGVVAYLEDSGFEVLEAEDGKVGLEIFEREKPDLVLTDLQMPEVSGLEVLERISKEYPDTPILVLSGAGGMDDVIEALRLGAWDYLTKPISDLAVLEHAVGQALERSRLIEENKRFAEQLRKNLQILEEDQAAGRVVQMSLLPENGLTFGAYNLQHSVTPSLYLSGDFVDYFSITENKIGVYLADVSGHGASSAFVTVLLKSLISQICSKYQLHGDKVVFSPEQTMQELSKEIYAAKLGKYMTMIYGILDLTTHEYIYGVGGHYPNPICLDGSGNASYLAGSGFPVGIMPTATFESQTVTIPAGGKLVLFSDGIMEVFMPEDDMEAKDAGLLEMVKETNADIPAMLTAISVDEESKQPDDITILVMSRN